MANVCQLCGKRVAVGHTISKAHNLTKRRFRPNLHKMTVNKDGKTSKMKVCSRCIRSGKITKVVRVPKPTSIQTD
ncbi:MAG: 50S ribosomal protein L28 [Candidatus Fischerbacteria bacterium RBG_13_37_8]|uniref:Large ribosomal subunit protein bL28 n=1 Tax=Candidatus Fischerbacteria bacterium RBG_13_37_8 TaxID=1817863 RepID=A0A1F5V5K3_9BACT|nr:MAG: 50S ribosomal protein L28 [Candidatus Fischerbacteria bacterium RBG_13_37_8]